MKKLLITVLAGVMLFGSSTLASAVMVGTPLNVGGPNVWLSAANNLTADVIEIAHMSSPYHHGTVFGTLDAWVYRDTDQSLIFAYQVSHNSGSDDGITRVTSTSFAGYTTEVGFDNVTGSRAPAFLDRGSIYTIGAQFYTAEVGPPYNYPGTLDLLPDETSYKWWIKTNSTVYVVGEASVQNGGSENVRTYAPSAIPEPGTMLLLGMGILGLFGLGKKKI